MSPIPRFFKLTQQVVLHKQKNMDPQNITHCIVKFITNFNVS